MLVFCGNLCVNVLYYVFLFISSRPLVLNASHFFQDEKEKDISEMERRATEYRGILDRLKSNLYAKFGKENINLETDQ